MGEGVKNLVISVNRSWITGLINIKETLQHLSRNLKICLDTEPNQPGRKHLSAHQSRSIEETHFASSGANLLFTVPAVGPGKGSEFPIRECEIGWLIGPDYACMRVLNGLGTLIERL